MTPTPHGQVPAIQRYKIGYPSDEWGMRSSTPGGVSDPSGQWVLYKNTIRSRIDDQGMSFEQAVQTPLQKRSRKD